MTVELDEGGDDSYKHAGPEQQGGRAGEDLQLHQLRPPDSVIAARIQPKFRFGICPPKSGRRDCCNCIISNVVAIGACQGRPDGRIARTDP